jgi:hypothetical protein
MVILSIPELILQQVSGQNETPTQSLGINEFAQFVGLSAAISGGVLAFVNYFLSNWGLKERRQLRAMKDKANACSEFCFHLTRMIHNDEFQLRSENIGKIEETFKDIDEKIKDNYYILDENVRLSWILLRSNWQAEYSQNHINFVKKAINLNNDAAKVLNISRKTLKSKIRTEIDEVKLLNYEDLKYYPILESIELLNKFLNDASRYIRDASRYTEDEEKLLDLYQDLKRSLSYIIPKAPVDLSNRFDQYDKEMTEQLESLDELELGEDPDIDILTKGFIEQIRQLSNYH